MNAIINLIRTQPAKTAGAITAILNAVALWGINLSGEQVASINIALAAIFGLFTASQVTPNVRLPDSVVKAAAEGDPPIPEIKP